MESSRDLINDLEKAFKNYENSFIIYKPTKSSMQSGLLNTKKWCLTNSSVNESYRSPKFGWDGTTNPEKKIELFFKTLNEAKRFAQTNNYNYKVLKPLKRKNY